MNSRTNINASLQEKKESMDLQKLMHFSDTVSGYIQDTQKMRGFAVYYTLSKGQKKSTELSAQKQKIDSSEAEMKQSYQDLPKEILSEDMKKHMKALDDLLIARNEFSAKIFKFEVSTDEIKKYCGAIVNAQLEIINDIARLSSDVEISRKLILSQILLQMREDLALERAMGLDGIFIGKFDDALYDRLIGNRNFRTNSTKIFLFLADEQVDKVFNEKVINHPTGSKLDDLRKKIIRNENCTIMPDDWFDATTSRLDQYREVYNDFGVLIMKKTESIIAQANFDLYKNVIISTIILAISILLAMMVIKAITKGIKEVVDISRTMAQGDFSQQLVVKSKDELGDLAISFNEMIHKLTELFNQLKVNGVSLASNSEELSAVSTQLLSASSKTKEQADSVASASEQMSTNIGTMASAVEQMSANTGSVSAAAEQMSQNMNTIASTIEEMSQSITEIGKSSNNSMKIASEAMTLSENATQTMNLLGNAAKEIGQVTSTIKSIAEKTDLLALNATIEAASAGEAGKGFAVVANEIKNLASRSAQAAENIADKISGIQKSSMDAVSVINNVSNIIKEINESIKVITHSVEEQATASNEVANNVSQANTGIQSIAASIGEIAKGASDISKNSGEAAKATSEVSQNISGVNENASNATSGAQQVNTSSLELSKMAGELRSLISKFKTRENV